jgi:hypothetical protein
VGRECVWILGKREPSWKPGGPAHQEGERAGILRENLYKKLKYNILYIHLVKNAISLPGPSYKKDLI